MFVEQPLASPRSDNTVQYKLSYWKVTKIVLLYRESHNSEKKEKRLKEVSNADTTIQDTASSQERKVVAATFIQLKRMS